MLQCLYMGICNNPKYYNCKHILIPKNKVIWLELNTFDTLYFNIQLLALETQPQLIDTTP